VSRLNKTEPAGKGWYEIPGVQVGDRTLSEQLIGLEPLFELASGKTILDLGCAEGLISLELMNAGAVLTHGVEAVSSRVDHAREHFQGRDAAFYHADLNDFATAPPVGLLESYDIVLLLSIIRKMRYTAAFVQAAAAQSTDIVAVRLPDAVIRDKRSNFEPVDVPALMEFLGFQQFHFAKGPQLEWVWLFRR
jgi:2-polyprenyl-3-methyl-5-hydroxy-6-metoxy-1,4-benzoquinol methylase